MRTPEKHLAAVEKLLATHGLASRPVALPLEEAAGYITAEAITAMYPSPLFDNSQMDGYAVSVDDLSRLPARCLVGPTIAAGDDPEEILPGGFPALHRTPPATPLDSSAAAPSPADQPTVLPIMTGARLPIGTGAVIPVEHCTPDTFPEEHSQVEVPATEPGAFLRLRGSDMPAGTQILPAGAILTPVAIAALASQGFQNAPVVSRKRVIICTGGAEIAKNTADSANANDSAATIPDANCPLLRALCARFGIEVAASLHTNDSVPALAADLRAAIAEHQPDAIITAGGISHGKFEVIRMLMEADSDPTHCWFGHVAQQPGGPQGLASYQGVPVICLPGNPISVLVSFRLFVAPSMGHHPTPVTAQLCESVRGLSGREQFRRGTLSVADDGVLQVKLSEGASSHLLARAALTDCLVRIPTSDNAPSGCGCGAETATSHTDSPAPLPAGTPVQIYPL